MNSSQAEEEVYFYMCTNDDCSRFEQIVAVHRGETAECQVCGYFMSADV